MVVNNQFPGPAIEANWGDEIEVTVHNNITAPMEGTAMHWHGFLQRGSNWMDGVPSVSQCPIAPGSSFTYRFAAQLYGTSFYHAHYSAQHTAGVAGPIIVHGPSQLPYDIDVGPVMLTDWFHNPDFSVWKDVVGQDNRKLLPHSDSLLINGRGRFDCANLSTSGAIKRIGTNIASNQTWECIDGAELSKFRFQSGKTHRLRLINHGANGETWPQC
jgi:FtsP/CotA-like multicopper oxidase with cupredoxin domain